jgi:putative effector of murein hydrolase LrgA (UPF0299 family)
VTEPTWVSILVDVAVSLWIAMMVIGLLFGLFVLVQRRGRT